ncbi:ABC transporter substrate-binding protein [Sphingomonas sp. RHCKR47]|uniref:ABC transporter substrate-binding protein n=1 Tax=Sphingomonas citricola TaxID=2862498 RepID=UPI001CA47D75|nr:ABC transporter substrate-binding protein [Sphingomonas citricola]MBW6524043.1 ABC transporter substrate-binding protein [Sphingomonas citricola]
MSAPLRVVSLLPSATEIAVAVGLGEQLLGRSHECDFPRFVGDLPVLTSTKLEKGLTSLEIDVRVQEIVRQGLSVYAVDTERLRAIRPDVILTQSQCAVCAVTPADLVEALNQWTGTQPVLVSLAPDDLSDVWGDFARVGEATGREAEAAAAVALLKERMAALEARVAASGERPTVASIEWTQPLMAAGNWVPELVRIAGGEPLFAAAGQHSPWLEWDALAEADPDVIVIMPCGYQIPQTMGELGPVVNHPRWRDLKAVRENRVFVADGHHFFNRPGPRLVESAEILAACIDQDERRDAGEGWVRLG